ncbi:hypothetical protein PF003_g6405 [Phytophthora fragariae]|nr:hypothetical protein PF003_g6405 [Phytophthora fragariae]
MSGETVNLPVMSDSNEHLSGPTRTLVEGNDGKTNTLGGFRNLCLLPHCDDFRTLR